MTVTEIRELNARKVLVTIDGHLVLPLYKNELRQYGLREEAEVDPARWSELWDVTLVKRSRMRAMNLLQKKNYTKAELERKLRENHYPQELIDQALAYVMKFHYVDDYRYAEDYIRYHSADRSRQRMRRDLLAKGISGEVFDSVWERFQADNEDWNEEAQIEQLLQKKNYDPEHADAKEKARMIALLYRKGYSAEAISACLDSSRRK
ncbi:MAG: recombination regulator RecX [Lachnospiraceae bacterium]|nr:recombination regulator RecX [Lachnospiraceae bacterium]